jgi:hypothetical protein
MKRFNLSTPACIKHHINRHALAMLLAATVVCLSGQASAQGKQETSWKVPEANTSYTQRLNVEVGDVPGHVVRIYEIHRKFADPPPIFAGTRAVEGWDRGQAEYVNLNGPSWGYTIFHMANGDKVFARFSGAVRTTVGSDGKTQTVYSGTTVLTGGTGKFKGIRGLFHETDNVDIAAGISETNGTGEYWFEQ